MGILLTIYSHIGFVFLIFRYTRHDMSIILNFMYNKIMYLIILQLYGISNS